MDGEYLDEEAEKDSKEKEKNDDEEDEEIEEEDEEVRAARLAEEAAEKERKEQQAREDEERRRDAPCLGGDTYEYTADELGPKWISLNNQFKIELQKVMGKRTEDGTR